MRKILIGVLAALAALMLAPAQLAYANGTARSGEAPTVEPYYCGTTDQCFKVLFAGTQNPYEKDWDKNRGGWSNWVQGSPPAASPNSFAAGYSNPTSPYGTPRFDLATQINGSIGLVYCNDETSSGWQLPNSQSVTTNIGAATVAVALDKYGSGVLEYTATATDGSTIAFNSPSSCGIASETNIGGVTQYSSTLIQTNASLYSLYVIGTDTKLWTNIFNSSGGWSGWTQTGPSSIIGTSSPSALNLGGVRYVFMRGTDNALWYTGSSDGVTWSTPYSLGGVLYSAPGCGTRDGSVTIDCFVVGQDLNIWTRDYNGTSWGAWTSIGSPSST